MRRIHKLSITLPLELADAVKAKVASGEYATESDVLRDGLRVLLDRDRAVDDWLRAHAAPAYDAMMADPARAISVASVRARLAAEHGTATKKGNRTKLSSRPRRKINLSHCINISLASVTADCQGLSRRNC